MPYTRAAAATKSNTPYATPMTTSKRKVSPASSTIKITNSKRTKTNIMSQEFIELKNLISSLSTSIGNKIDESQSALENKFASLDSNFNNLASQVNAEIQSIKTSVSEFQTKVVNEMESINSVISNHGDRLNNAEDDMQRALLCHDVRLVGFAVKENENLTEIFSWNCC